VGYLDGYCERTGPGPWAEPLNAVSNLAFLVAALALWRRGRDAPPAVRLLAVLIGLIGLASTAWHTLATPWSAAADSGTIAIFLLYYIVLSARLSAAVPGRLAWLAAPAFVLLTVVLSAAADAVGLGLPGVYPAALLTVAGMTVAARGTPYRRPMAAATLLFAASLTARTFDEPLCPWLPTGTHFAWHVANAGALFLVSRVALGRAVTIRTRVV
jgi:hypothetical protein